jgi:hypothetical protein
MKNANQEEKLQREANEAAITALGGHRNTKSWNRYDPMRTSIAHGINIQVFHLFFYNIPSFFSLFGHVHVE